METVELVKHQELIENLEEVLDGVKDVVIIQQLFKNMICIYVDVVLERLQFLWDLIKTDR